jgi:hypothetical protein
MVAFSARPRRIAGLAGEVERVVVGELVLGRFRIEQKLGSGGFGTVYRAWDSRLERDVAVKVIESEGEASRRVLREAQAAARLNHPGIVTLYELGEEQGRAYLVSELVEGDTLRRLSLDGELSDREIGEIGADLCEALDHAHARGIVHRDLKPQNVLVCDHESRAKLMDFGIARMLDGAALTATGSVVGTLAYMAPEQAEGLAAGPEADVFSLALTLYECWSGENPHVRATPAATARAIGAPLPSLGRHRRDLPPDLVDAIDAALDPDPRRRPSLEALGTEIEEALEALSDEQAAPRAGAPLAHVVGRLEAGGALGVGFAAALGGLLAAAVIAVGAADAAWGLLLAPVAAGLSLLNARLGYLAGSLGLTAWLAAAGRPGAAVVLAAMALPPFLLLPDCRRGLLLPAAAPVLGTFGAALAFPLLAALAGRWRDRAVLAAAGYAWLIAAEAILHRDLLFGTSIDPARGWQESAGGGLTEVLGPILTQPRTLGAMAGWALGAVFAGAILSPLRSRAIQGPRNDRREAAPGRLAAPASAAGGAGRQATLS